MPRTARIVVPGVAHHVTQRGNRRQQTFFEQADYVRYVDLVKEGCEGAGVSVVAWCLMPNHVHLVLVPLTPCALAKALALAHRKYTWVVNRRNGWQGHLWQNRFFSSPMDDEHLLQVMRYVELNPVRARLVEKAEHWRWSSAPARVTGRADALVGEEAPCVARTVQDWSAFLAAGIERDVAARIRDHQSREAPMGSEAFLSHIETLVGRRVRPRPRGRPPRTLDVPAGSRQLDFA